MVRQIAYAHHKYTLILLLIGRDYTLNTLKSLRNRTLITPSYLSISHNSLLPLSFGATYLSLSLQLAHIPRRTFHKATEAAHTLSIHNCAYTKYGCNYFFKHVGHTHTTWSHDGLSMHTSRRLKKAHKATPH